MIEGKTGHHEESLRALKKVTSLNPESADADLNLGIALADQFDLQGALKEFSEAIRLDPNAAAAYYNKGRVLYDLNRRQEALPFLKTACRLEPNYASALSSLGTSPQAKDVLEKLVSVDPENAEAHSMRAQALLREGNTRAAITEWKAAVQLDPQNSSSLYNLSRLLASVHDPEAEEYTDRFQELQRTRQLSDRVQTLNNFALEAANAHKWLQAVEQLQESIKACGDCKQLSILHRNLGLIYARSGDVKDAEREFSAALKLSPQDADAQRLCGFSEVFPNRLTLPRSEDDPRNSEHSKARIKVHGQLVVPAILRNVK
jgi:tetratricopeptide (TPR) repeat protein